MGHTRCRIYEQVPKVYVCHCAFTCCHFQEQNTRNRTFVFIDSSVGHLRVKIFGKEQGARLLDPLILLHLRDCVNIQGRSTPCKQTPLCQTSKPLEHTPPFDLRKTWNG